MLTRRCDPVWVFLGVAFEGQEIVVAAAALAGEFAADGGAGIIDRAAAGLGVDELADRGEMLIFLVTQDAFALFLALHGELLVRFLGADAKVVGKL